MDLYRMIRVPYLLNPLFIQHHHTSTYTALHALPISMLSINMALTLISVTYPFHYGWNYLSQSPTSHITQTPQTLVSRFILQTETYYYLQFNDGIVIHDTNNKFKSYYNKSYIPHCMKDHHNDPTNFPFRWTPGIEEFCQVNSYRPDCLDPICCANVEKQFIASTIHKPENFPYLKSIFKLFSTTGTGRIFNGFIALQPLSMTTSKNALCCQNYILKLTTIKVVSSTPNKDYESPPLKKNGSTGRCSLLVKRSNFRKLHGHN